MIMSNSTYNQLTANLELLKLTQMKLHLDAGLFFSDIA
jgi:hypothetical protein